MKQLMSYNKKPTQNVQKINKHSLFFILIPFLLIITIAILLLYGPYAGFRNFWVSTAMNTASHKYLAEIFYSKATIDNIMAQNLVVEPDENTDINKISDVASNGKIELITIDEFGCTGYLLKINDPSRVSVVPSKDSKGMLLEEMTSDAGGIASINASGYLSIDEPGIPTGVLISNSETIFEGRTGEHSIIGFDTGNNLILGNYEDSEIGSLNLRDAVEFGPMLIVNGIKSSILGNGGGYAPRSAIGQTSSGEVLFLVLDGRTITNMGATLKDVQDILAEYGAINAANLDGGSSVSMFYNGSLVNTPTSIDKHRILSCCFVVR